MKTVGDLSPRALKACLTGTGLRLRTGPVVTSVRSSLDAVRDGIALHYAHHELLDEQTFADFHVSVDRPAGLRRFLRPQVLFMLDGVPPFKPLPGDQGFPLFEWGMNWCFYAHVSRYLIIHAAVIERHGRALILPAPPGSGKSTLCAALVWRGWRLLSDELTVIDLQSGVVVPVPRPVSLKNASIDVIKGFAPEATFTPVVRETAKGSVAHFSPHASAVRDSHVTATPAWVVLPRYVAGAPTRIEALSRGHTLMALVDNSFNYHLHGARGFEALCALVERSSGYAFSYSVLDEAVDLFSQLADSAASAAA